MQATSYLCAAWEALASREEVPMPQLAVVFEGVAIVQAVPAQADEDIVLAVLLDQRGGFQARICCDAL
jgi:hypothetical protein